MLTVEIKLPSGIAGLGSAVAASLPEVARAVRNDISTYADRELKSSLIDYRRGLQIANYAVSPAKLRSGGTFRFAAITLSGWLANAIEEGWEGGDMVPGLLAGRSGRTSSQNNIPIAAVRFRHTQPGTTGAVGGVMGGLEQKRGMNRQQAALVGKAIARAAKQLSANESKQGGPARLSQATANAAGARILKGTAPGARQHATSIYAGMRKTVDPAGTQYESFRTVSGRASGGKFLHPGISARRFFDRALKRLDGHARMIIAAHVDGLSSS